MRIKDGVILPVSSLRTMREVFDFLLRPIDEFFLDQKLGKIFREEGIEFVGDLIQIPEEKVAERFSLTPMQKEKIRAYLHKYGFLSVYPFSDFLQFIYQCAKVYRKMGCPKSEGEISLIMVLLKSTEDDFRIKKISAINLSRLKNPEQEITGIIRRII